MKKKNSILSITVLIFVVLSLGLVGCGSKSGNKKNDKDDVVADGDTWRDIPEEEVVLPPETVTVVDEATGHIHNYKGVLTKDATCDKSGEFTYTCSECGNSYIEEVHMKGHEWKDTKVAATKTTQGYTLHTCVKCNTSYKSDYTPKTASASTSNHKHTYTSQITLVATCASTGVKTFTCSSCSDTYTETIPKTNHKWVQGLRTVHHEAEYYEVDITEYWCLQYDGWYFFEKQDNCYFGSLYWIKTNAKCDHNNQEYRAKYIKQSEAVNADSTKEEVAENWRILDEMAWNRAQEMEACGCVKIVEWMPPSVVHEQAWNYYFHPKYSGNHLIGTFTQETKSVKVGTEKRLAREAYDTYEPAEWFDCSLCGARKN